MGRYGCATDNCLYTVGMWLGLAGGLGGIGNRARHDANRRDLGFSLHDRLVGDRWGEKGRQPAGQLTAGL